MHRIKKSEVIQHLAYGFTVREIARRLHCDRQTVLSRLENGDPDHKGPVREKKREARVKDAEMVLDRWTNDKIPLSVIAAERGVTRQAISLLIRDSSRFAGRKKRSRNWTERERSMLRTLWTATPTLSTLAIGRKMDRSKNSVIGEANRLLLAPRPSPIKRRATTKGTRK